MSKHIIIKSLILTMFLLLTPLFSVHAQVTPTSTPSASSTGTQSAIAPLPTLTYDQILVLYGNFSTEVAKSAQNAVDLIKWVISLIAVFGGGLVGLGGFMMRQANAAKDASESSAKEAKKSQDEIELLRKQIIDANNQLDAAKKTIETLGAEVKYLLPDSMNILETIVSVEGHKLKLIGSSDRIEQQLSEIALIQLSMDNSPIIRRLCAEVFGDLTGYSRNNLITEEIIKRLKYMKSDDDSIAVKYEAERALIRIESTNGS